MLGTLINVVTVVAGSSVGLLLKNRMKPAMTSIIFHVLGVFTLFIGFKQSLESNDLLLLVLSLVVGAIIGQALKLEERLEMFVSRFDKNAQGPNSTFTQGLMTAFMIFCVGTLTVLGCFQEGIEGDRKLIVTKSIMDLFSSMALATAFGRGVLFSVIPLFIYQGSLTLGAGYLEPFLDQAMREELFAAGGLMLIALGLNILKIMSIKVINLLPGLITAVFFTWIAQKFGLYNLL